MRTLQEVTTVPPKVAVREQDLMDDTADIVALLRRRDEEGLRALFTRYGGPVYAVIVATVGDERVAEEVLQDTLLRAWDRIDGYDPERAGLFAWLAGIARHAAIDRVRLRGFRETYRAQTFDPAEHAPETTGEPSTDALDVAALTAGLDAKYLAVLELVYFSDYSAAEAAEALGIPVGTAKTRLRRALVLLRERLGREGRHSVGVFLALASLPLSFASTPLSWLS